MNDTYAAGLIRKHLIGSIDAKALRFVVRCYFSGFCDAVLKDDLMNFTHLAGMRRKWNHLVNLDSAHRSYSKAICTNYLSV